MPEPALDELAAAVVDGERIDWAAAEGHITTGEGFAQAAELKALSTLSHRALTVPASGRAARPRHTWMLRGVRALALAQGAAGVIGTLVALSVRPAAVQTVVMLLALLAFASAALLLDVSARDRRAGMLAGAYWAIAAAFSAPGILELASRWPDATWIAALMAARPEAFLPAFMWSFAREFPHVNHFSRIDRVSVAAARATVPLVTVLFVINLLPLLHPALAEFCRPLVRLPRGGPWFWNIVFGTTIPALLMIAWRARRATGEESRRARVFLCGIVFALGPVAIEVVAEGFFPRLAAIMETSRGRFWGGAVIYPPLLALPLLTAYAVAVRGVLDIRVVIRQALRYLLGKWLVFGSAVGVTGFLLVYLYYNRHQSLASVLAAPGTRALVVVDLAAVFVLLCRPRLVRELDRWRLSERQDASTLLAGLTERLKNCRTPMEISSTLAAAAARSLETTTEVLVLNGDRLWPMVNGTVAPPAHSLMPVLAAGAHGPCFVDDGHRQSYYALLTQDDRDWIDGERIALMVPVPRGRGEQGLSAVICVRHRKNGETFSIRDLRFIAAAAASAALALDGLPVQATVGTGRPPHDELAFQCATCRRVDAWLPDQPACGCGGSWQPAAVPKALLDRFTVDQFIGSGGMGAVYLARDVRLGRHVAVKTLTRLSTAAAERLMTEARTMAGLSHPHIAVLYGTEIWRGTPMLILEYLPGGTLASRLAQGPFSAPEAIGLLIRLAGALDHLHQAGLYHGDIKPSNIGFAADGTAKYLDFGLSRAVRDVLPAPEPGESTSPTQHLLGGTPAYMSPEVLDGRGSGPALDLWALTVVLYECLAGRHPFLDRAGTLSGIPDGLPLSKIDSLIPLAARPWFNGALSSDQTRRPRSAAELSNQLTELLATVC